MSINLQANLYVVLKDFRTLPTKDEVREYFAQFGEIAEVRDSSDKRNIFFVEFFDSRCSTKALDMCSGPWKEGTVDVKYASFSKFARS